MLAFLFAAAVWICHGADVLCTAILVTCHGTVQFVQEFEVCCWAVGM